MNINAVAYCYASGQIGFARRTPKGALPLLRGPERRLRNFLEAVARHAYDGKTLLVPGLPEAENQDVALDKLQAFLNWIEPQAAKKRLILAKRAR